MCQLSLIHLGDKRLNRLLSLSLAVRDSSTANKDGFGILANGGKDIWKTKESASNLIDIGYFLRETIKNDGPIMQHVRLASLGPNNLKVITKEKAHPFDTQHYVVFHNGSLELKDDKLDGHYFGKNMIDSEIFAAELEKNYETDFFKALEKTVDEFYGKWAFMIFDKTSGNYYVARGDTALLHQSTISFNGKKVGLVVNTDRLDLLWGIINFKNQVELITGGTIEYTEIEELQKETAFVLDKEKATLLQLGSIKETKKPYSTSYYYSRGRNADAGSPPFRHQNGGTENSFTYDTSHKAVAQFLKENHLNLQSLDLICYALFGKYMLGLSYDEIEELVKKAIPALKNRVHPKYQKVWNDILTITKLSGIEITKRYDLQFPYFMNEYSRLKVLLGNLKREESENLNPPLLGPSITTHS